MSRINVDNVGNRQGTSGPTLDGHTTVGGNLDVSGSGDFTGNVQIDGDLRVDGDSTFFSIDRVDVEDKVIGIASTATPTNLTADGGGIVVYGSADGSNDKTFLWQRDTGCWEVNQPLKMKGVVETVAVAATSEIEYGRVSVNCDLASASVFTHSLAEGENVGIVSFFNMPADSGVQNGLTVTVIFTQNSLGLGNTTPETGIGTFVKVAGYEDGVSLSGIDTSAKVGNGAAIVLSTTGSDRDFVSFFIHYTGGDNSLASSYQVYGTRNGEFR